MYCRQREWRDVHVLMKICIFFEENRSSRAISRRRINEIVEYEIREN